MISLKFVVNRLIILGFCLVAAFGLALPQVHAQDDCTFGRNEYICPSYQDLNGVWQKGDCGPVNTKGCWEVRPNGNELFYWVNCGPGFYRGPNSLECIPVGVAYTPPLNLCTYDITTDKEEVITPPCCEQESASSDWEVAKGFWVTTSQSYKDVEPDTDGNQPATYIRNQFRSCSVGMQTGGIVPPDNLCYWNFFNTNEAGYFYAPTDGWYWFKVNTRSTYGGFWLDDELIGEAGYDEFDACPHTSALSKGSPLVRVNFAV